MFSYQYNTFYKDGKLSIFKDKGSNSKTREKGLQNEYIDLHWSILTNPQLTDKILSPLDINDFGDACDLAEFGEKKVIPDSIISPMFNEKAFFENRSGKTGVAAESLVATFNALSQGTDLELVENIATSKGIIKSPFAFKANVLNKAGQLVELSLNKLSSSTGLKGLGLTYQRIYELRDGVYEVVDIIKRTKSDLLMNMQNEAVDNAKSGNMGRGNLNDYTMGAANSLARLESTRDGENMLSMNSLVWFLKQQVIMEYVQKAQTLNDTTVEDFNPNKKKEMLVALMDKYYDIAQTPKGMRSYEFNKDYVLPVELSNNSSNPGLFELLTKNGMDDRIWAQHQVNLLKMFIMLDELGAMERDILTGLNSDTKGVGKSLIASGIKEDNFADISEGKKKSVPTLDGSPSLSIAGIENIANETRQVGQATINSVNLANQLFKDFYPYKSIIIQRVMTLYSMFTGKNKESQINENDQRSLINAFKSFCFTHNVTGLFENTTIEEERRRLLTTQYDREYQLIDIGNVDKAMTQRKNGRVISNEDLPEGTYKIKNGQLMTVKKVGSIKLEKGLSLNGTYNSVTAGVQKVDAKRFDQLANALGYADYADFKSDYMKSNFTFFSEQQERFIYEYSFAEDANKVQSLALRLKKFKNKYPNNYFLKRLSSELARDITKEFDLVKYSSAVTQKMDDVENTRSFAKLLVSEDEDTRTFANDLIKYAYITGGIQNANSFIKYIPAQVLMHNDFSSGLRDLQASLNDVETEGVDYISFLRQYFQHNPYKAVKLDEVKLLGVKDVYNFAPPDTFIVDANSDNAYEKNLVSVNNKLADEKSDGVLGLEQSKVGFESEKTVPKFAYIYDLKNKKPILYEASETFNGFIYTKIGLLGTDKLGVVEYDANSSNTQSLLKNKQISSQNKIQEEIPYEVPQTQSLFDVISPETPVEKPFAGVEAIKSTGLSISKSNHFIDILQPIIKASAERENVSKNANYMFAFGKRWTRIKAVRGANKEKFDKLFQNPTVEFTKDFEAAEKLTGYAKLKVWQQLLNKHIGTKFDTSIVPFNKNWNPSGFNYSYDANDAMGNPVASMNTIKEITKYIESKTGRDMSNYNSVLANIYTENQFIPPHRDTTEDERARKYPIIVFNIGADGSITEVDSNKSIKVENGGIYQFGIGGVNRFEFYHTINPKEFGSNTPTKPITLPDGTVLKQYRITMTYRMVNNPADLGILNEPAVVENKPTQQEVKPQEVKRFVNTQTDKDSFEGMVGKAVYKDSEYNVSGKIASFTKSLNSWGGLTIKLVINQSDGKTYNVTYDPNSLTPWNFEPAFYELYKKLDNLQEVKKPENEITETSSNALFIKHLTEIANGSGTYSELAKLLLQDEAVKSSKLGLFTQDDLQKDLENGRTTPLARANSTTKEIKFNKASFNKMQDYTRTLLHEALHISTVTGYNAYNLDKEAYTKANPEKGRIYKQLDLLRETVINKLKEGKVIKLKNGTTLNHAGYLKLLAKQLKTDQEPYNAEDEGFYYGLTNTKEFISVVMTDPMMQEALSNIEYSGNKSLFDRLADLFKRFVNTLAKERGIKVDNTILEESVANVLDLISAKKDEQQSNTKKEISVGSVPRENIKNIKDPDIKYEEVTNRVKDEFNPVFKPATILINGVQVETTVFKNGEKVNITLNEDQLQAVQEFADVYDAWIKNPSKASNTFTLLGRGGRGKTSITRAMLNYVKKKHGKSEKVVSAFTHKACKVATRALTGKSTGYKTVASIIAGIYRNAKIKPAELYVFDEISMIGQRDYDTIMNHINGHSRIGNHSFVITMGDIHQLPPIKETGNKVSPFFKKLGKIVDLEKPMRFARESGIFRLSESIANNLKDLKGGVIAYGDSKEGDVKIVSSQKEAVSAFMKYFRPVMNDTKEKSMTKILAYGNSTVAVYNNLIRNQIYGLKAQEQQVLKGEILMGQLNWGQNPMQVPIQNSQDYVVVNDPIEESYTPSFTYKNKTYKFDLQGLSLEVTEPDSDEFDEPRSIRWIDVSKEQNKPFGQFILDLNEAMGRLHPKEKFNSEERALLENIEALGIVVPNILIRANKTGIIYSTNEIYELVRKSYNITEQGAVMAKYEELIREGKLTTLDGNIQHGYALSVHKSQGSTYKNVIVDEKNISYNEERRFVNDLDGKFFGYESNHMRYVAFSRASENLIIFTEKSTDEQLMLTSDSQEDNMLTADNLSTHEKDLLKTKKFKLMRTKTGQSVVTLPMKPQESYNAARKEVVKINQEHGDNTISIVNRVVVENKKEVSVEAIKVNVSDNVISVDNLDNFLSNLTPSERLLFRKLKLNNSIETQCK